MRQKTKLAIRQMRVIRYDDGKILTQYIIGQEWEGTTPTVLGLIKHWTEMRKHKNPEVQAKFKAFTLPFIKEEITKWFY